MKVNLSGGSIHSNFATNGTGEKCQVAKGPIWPGGEYLTGGRNELRGLSIFEGLVK